MTTKHKEIIKGIIWGGLLSTLTNHYLWHLSLEVNLTVTLVVMVMVYLVFIVSITEIFKLKKKEK